MKNHPGNRIPKRSELMVLLSHPTGNSFVRSAVAALEQVGLLAEFWTCFAWDKNSPWSGFLPVGVRNELQRRSFHLEEPKRLRTRPGRELARLVSNKLGWQKMTRHESGVFSIDAVYRALDRDVASRLKNEKDSSAIRIVYAYEDSARESFRTAKEKGMRCVYDLSIGYHASARKIFQEEAERMPEFASTLTGLQDSEAKLECKKEEVELADLIVACSPFVGDTLKENGIPEEKVRVVQFGSPDAVTPRDWTAEDLKRPLRLLFAGAVGQRKGIGYILHALRKLGRKDVELVLLGTMPREIEMFRPYADLFRHEGPRPHGDFLALMRTCDVLILPSIFEGQALVILEAMACGLAVLITPNTGAQNLVQDGREGFVVPAHSIDALAEKISWYADHRDALPEMGAAASIRSSQTTWANYQSQIIAVVKEALA